MPHGEIASHTVWWQRRRHAQAIHAIAYRIFVAVPVAHYHRQSGRHRLNWRQTKGFLNVVRERHKHIGTLPCLLITCCVLPVHPDKTYGRGQSFLCGQKTSTDGFVGKYTGFDADYWRVLGHLLQSLIGGRRVGFGVKR